MNDQTTRNACYTWSMNMLKALEAEKLLTAAEIERIAKLSEQHYQPSLIVL